MKGVPLLPRLTTTLHSQERKEEHIFINAACVYHYNER